MFSVVNMYLDHLNLCGVCIHGRGCVRCSECYIVSNECDEPTPALCNLSARTVMNCFMGDLGFFLNCDYICMCVGNKQFELLELVFNSVYIDLKYNEIYLTFTGGSVCLCGVCSHVVVPGLSVRLSWYPMGMR